MRTQFVAALAFLAGMTAPLQAQDNAAPAGTPPKTAETESSEPFKIVVPVKNVVAPVSVLDKSGNFVVGLKPESFELYDNGKKQEVTLDVVYEPLSLVVAVQASNRMEAVLGQIKKASGLFDQVVGGEGAEIALLAYDHRIREMQGFTNDSKKLQDAMNKINPGSTSCRMIDAVNEAVAMLKNKPSTRRRVILLIGETRDISSEARVREVVINAQLANVEIYTVNVSRLVTSIFTKPQDPRPEPQPPAAYGPLPMGTPSTPATIGQYTQAGTSVQFVPLLMEVYKGVKGIFVEDPLDFFTKATGGTQYTFVKQRSLENAISAIGAEIHNQYLLTYNPNNLSEGGFHQISVTVKGSGDYQVRTRPGYWLATVQ